MRHSWMVVLALGALGCTGCVTSEVTRTSDLKLPPQPEGCPVQIFTATPPTYPWKDIASVSVRCNNWVGRTGCIDELKNKTCEVGGNTLYGFQETVSQRFHYIVATIATRSGETKPQPVPTAAGAPGQPKPPVERPVASCDPPCSPGYKCQGTQCMPVCNPSCDANEICNRKRICVAKPASPAPSTTPAPAPAPR